METISSLENPSLNCRPMDSRSGMANAVHMQVASDSRLQLPHRQTRLAATCFICSGVGFWRESVVAEAKVSWKIEIDRIPSAAEQNEPMAFRVLLVVEKCRLPLKQLLDP